MNRRSKKMVRIQLASNFQVIELTYENWESVDTDELKDATNLVNELGSKVKNEVKTKTQDNNPPTPAQLSLCKKLNIDVKGKDKEQVRQMIKEAINK